MTKRRITWTDLPEAVTAWVETTLGSPVVDWRSQSGGWSPGTADRLVCSDGSRAFLKAVHPSLNPVAPRLYRDEIAAAAVLGPQVPCAHLISSYDADGWVGLLFEDIEGRHPVAPWREAELRAVLRALDELAAATTPIGSGVLPTAGETYSDDFGRFAELSSEQVATCDPWVREHLDELVSRGARAGRVVEGESLGHGDLRADNLLVQPDGRVRIVDWPNACTSAPWLDGVLLAPNIENLGGLRGDGGAPVDFVALLTAWAATHGASQDDVVDVLVGMLAYYTWAAMQPEAPGLPTLRRDQGIAARAALRVVQRVWPVND